MRKGLKKEIACDILHTDNDFANYLDARDEKWNC